MPRESKPEACTCLKLLEMQEGIKTFADEAAVSVVELFGDACPELVGNVVDHIVARLLHIQILSDDHEIEDHRLPEEMEKRITAMSGRLPALLMVIIQEAMAREGTVDVRH
jgi:hypothetical protein